MSFANQRTPIKRVYDRTSHILIVDDDQTLLKFFKIHLNKFFSRVIVVGSAEEAMKVMKSKDIDLVISDIKMPKTDGLNLLEQITKIDPTIPIYLITGGTLNSSQTGIAKKFAEGIVRKPFSIEDIENVINNGMNKRQAFRDLEALIPDKRKRLAIVKNHEESKKLRGKEKRAAVEEILLKLHPAA